MNNINQNNINTANIINIKDDLNRLVELLTELGHYKYEGDQVNIDKYNDMVYELGQSVNQRIKEYEHLFTKKEITEINSLQQKITLKTILI